MLGMSIFDLLCSTGYMMSTWPIPKYINTYAAIGNDATCSTQAFFQQLGIGAPFYNLFLAMYYYLVIVKNSPPDGKWSEYAFHIISLVFAFGTAIAGLAAGMYGYATFWCWITVEHSLFRWIFW